MVHSNPLLGERVFYADPVSRDHRRFVRNKCVKLVALRERSFFSTPILPQSKLKPMVRQ
jgi:hypothetical protein